MLVTMLPRQLGHGVMSMLSHAGDSAADATTLPKWLVREAM
jgi:hypothetical protein